MDKVVYHRKKYIIVQKSSSDFIIVNTEKNFDKGHTHVKGYNYARLIVNIMIDERIKYNKHIRLLDNKHFRQSIKRLSMDDKIANKILRLTS